MKIEADAKTVGVASSDGVVYLKFGRPDQEFVVSMKAEYAERLARAIMKHCGAKKIEVTF